MPRPGQWAREMAEHMVFSWDDEQSWERADPATVAATMAAHQEFIVCHAARRRSAAPAACLLFGRKPVRPQSHSRE